MNTLQFFYDKNQNSDEGALLRAAGLKRLHEGWYSVQYRGVKLDKSTICAAKRNKNGQIKEPPKIIWINV